MSGILDGVRVLDLSIVTAGGATTQVLADFGADVVKVEAPDRPDLFREWTTTASSPEAGDLSSPPFRTANRNKRSLAVNIKDPRGLDVVQRLARRSDVVVENFRRGVIDRLGLGFTDLVALQPRIVLVSISSQGSVGPSAQHVSFGSTLDALGGLMSITGYDPQTPLWSSNTLNYPDQAVSLLAPALVVLGIRNARATGSPHWIDLSQRETVTSLLGEWLLERSLTGTEPLPDANNGRDESGWTSPCSGDDEWVAISVRNDDEVRACAAVVGLAPSTPLSRGGDLTALRAATERWSRARTKGEAMETLQLAGVPAAAVMKGYELLDDPYFTEIEWFQRVERSFGGDELQRGWAVRFATDRPSVHRRAPHLGEHTVEVLGTMLGFSAAEIEALIRDAVVRVSAPD